MDDDEKTGIRGGELADDAGGPAVAPEAPADGSGLRGEGLAEGAQGDAPDGELAEGGIRGDGLAQDG